MKRRANVLAPSICRALFEQWPEPLVPSFHKLNVEIYVPMQDPSELGISGKLASWDRSGFAMYDDQKTYFDGLIQFINDVNSGRF